MACTPGACEAVQVVNTNFEGTLGVEVLGLEQSPDSIFLRRGLRAGLRVWQKLAGFRSGRRCRVGNFGFCGP